VIQNPILPGFFPDPSLCHVVDIYYFANSTFDWFPSAPIQLSRNRMNLQLIGNEPVQDGRFGGKIYKRLPATPANTNRIADQN
jgi:beta-xylosidase